MQAILNRLTSPVRSLATTTSVVLFLVVALCLVAPTAQAVTLPPPIAVTGPATVIGDMQYQSAGGGWFSGQGPLGGTFVVGANGHVIIGDGYGKGVFEITPSGTQTVLANFNNSNAAGIDKYGNVYIARDYGPSIIKIPYNAATGVYAGFTTLPTANCLGGTQDTAACVFAPGTQALFAGENGGFSALFFDAQGNFFLATDTNPANNPDTIYECSAQCQAETDGNGTYPAVPVYADAKAIGAVAIDPWGNLFFADGADNGANSGKVSYLEELPISGGHYAASPTVITSYTTSAQYNAICGVYASNLGAVYFTVANDGVFAVPNNSSGPNAAGIYKVSNQGGKGLTLDATGNIYVEAYANALSHDGVMSLALNNLSFAASPVGTAAPAIAATAIDSAANCTTAPTLTFTDTEGGVVNTEFATVAGTTCSTAVGTSQGTFSPALASTGAAYTATITFTPTAAGGRNAALVIADSTNNASGVTALSGVGQGAAVNVDPGVWTSITTGLSSPASVVADAAGDLFVADSSGAKVYKVAAGTTTLTPVGTGFVTPTALAMDAQGNLFIADDGLPGVEEIINTSSTGAFAAGSQTTIIGTTALFGGKALGSAMGLAVGPNGTLYISDPVNKQVVYYNLLTGNEGVTLANTSNGVVGPAGLAADTSNNLYVADASANKVFVVTGTGAVSSFAVTGFTQPSGVAVDGSGSVLVSDAGTGAIARVPDLSGTLTAASAVNIETIPSQASSLSMDSLGNIYVASAGGKAAYAIKRNGAAVNLGTVQDGVTNSASVILQVTGTASATLATPGVTQPANTMFTLVAAASNGCSDGTSGTPGQSCKFTATFAPPVGTANGPQSGMATINGSVPATALNVALSGTATVSSILAQTITGFNPPTTIQAGQQITLSATGGGSGNPVTFTVDPTSACPTCATIVGTKLTAISAGGIKVDANQAAGSANGNQYAAATQVQAAITINNNLVATGVPALLMNQQNWLLALPNGGAFGGAGAGGTSMGVDPNGDPIVGTAYGSSIYLYSVKNAAWTKLGSFSNAAGVAVDGSGNLYISGNYSGVIGKIPWNATTKAYATLTDPSGATAPPHCTGTDTAECVAVSGVSGISGVTSMAFDAQGDMFIATDDQGTAHSIWECTAACIATGSPAPTMLFVEPTGAAPATTGQLYLGGIAVDPWGNLFFTDSNFINQSGGSNESSYSDLYELKYTTGTGYAATPTLLETFTNKTPGGYDDELDAVNVTSNGTIYWATQYDGVFAMPNTQAGGPVQASGYAVAAAGAKEFALDSKGNIYWVAYDNANGGDTIGQVLVGDLTAPIAQLQGAPVTTPAAVIDNAFGCGTAAVISVASSNPEFGVNTGTTCSSVAVGSGNGTLSTPVPSASSYTSTITFQATSGGPQTANLTMSDTANGGLGTATVTGVGQETPQTITFTAPTVTTYTFAPGLTVTLGATGGGSQKPVTFTVDASSSGAGTISGNTLTVTQAGTIVIDANEVGGLVSGVFYDSATQAQLSLTVGQAAQAIIFAPPTSPITYAPGLTDALNATGGGSGNTVVFTVDPSSTGAGTISGSTLTVTQAGNIVIDANQTANVNYLAAPQVQQTIVVNQAAQTITFIPLTQAFHYIVGGVTISIQATGGGSNGAIVFKVDSKSTMTGSFSTATVNGATSTTTLTIPAQTATSGTIIVDATQPGTTNYAAATQTQETINVLAPLPTQTITFATPQTQVGGTTLAIVASTTAGPLFPIVYTSSTTSVCTISGSTATFVKVAAASTCTITASQPGDNLVVAAAIPVTQTFAVNPSGQTPSMKLTLSLSSLTIAPGTVGLTQITINSVNNFAGSVNFACGGLPTGYSCTFNPNPISFAPSPTTGLPQISSATTTLTVTPPATASLVRHDLRPLFPATFAVALCFLGFKKRNRLQLFLLLVVVFAGLGMISGCGGSSGAKTTAPVTTSATITATSGSMSTSAPLTVILE